VEVYLYPIEELHVFFLVVVEEGRWHLEEAAYAFVHHERHVVLLVQIRMLEHLLNRESILRLLSQHFNDEFLSSRGSIYQLFWNVLQVANLIYIEEVLARKALPLEQALLCKDRIKNRSQTKNICLLVVKWAP